MKSRYSFVFFFQFTKISILISIIPGDTHSMITFFFEISLLTDFTYPSKAYFADIYGALPLKKVVAIDDI